MHRYFILFSFSFLTLLSAKAQTGECHRYKDIIFSDIRIDKNLVYEGKPSNNKKEPHAFDLYMPKADTLTNRPLIIWMHGGGFKFGSKEAKSMKLWCKTFAARGYVCASINYRLSKHNPLFNFDELLRSCYYAVQDANAAIEYFRAHAVEYHIDTDKIILAGNSAGGMIALQAAYSTNRQLAEMADLPDTVAGVKRANKFKIAAVINLWGGIFNPEWMKNAKIPVVNILGSRDWIVPLTHKDAPIYGGVDIHTQADVLGIPNKLKVFEGYSHELQKRFNPFFRIPDGTKGRWLEAGQFAADFLYESALNH